MLNIPLDNSLAQKHYNSIKDDLIARINNVLKLKYCGSAKTVLYRVDANCEKYLRGLIKEDKKKHNYPNLEKLILAKPNELIPIICDTKSKHKELFNNPIKKNGNKKWCDFNRILYNIFVDHAYKKLNKQDFILDIGLETCPYCNRNYTYIVEDGTVKPQVDHFFPKSQYPFLAISYYNLIPSCSTCNGLQVKGEKDPLMFDSRNKTQVIDEILINPYLINLKDFEFSYSIRTPYVLSKNYIEINLKVLANGYNEIFKLDELYKMHADHVEELIQKARIKHPLSYRKMLDTQFKTNLMNLPKSLYYRVVVGNYIFDDELHKRPLSKLYRDIALQLGIITSQDLSP